MAARNATENVSRDGAAGRPYSAPATAQAAAARSETVRLLEGTVPQSAGETK